MQTIAQSKGQADPHRDLLSYRDEFPILQNKTFMNTWHLCLTGSGSRGTVRALDELRRKTRP